MGVENRKNTSCERPLLLDSALDKLMYCAAVRKPIKTTIVVNTFPDSMAIK